MIECIAELEARTDFAPLLDRLAEYIRLESGRAAPVRYREVLSSIVLEACMIYDGIKSEVDSSSEKTLHELPELLTRIEPLLTADANYDDILIALGAPETLNLTPNDPAMRRAVDWHDSIVEGLDRIARAAPQPPSRRSGRPALPRDLRLLVFFLANIWEQHTGQRPTQDWHDGQPITNAAKFIYDVVKFVDPQRLAQLQTAMKQFVADRIAERQDSWWRVTS